MSDPRSLDPQANAESSEGDVLHGFETDAPEARARSETQPAREDVLEEAPPGAAVAAPAGADAPPAHTIAAPGASAENGTSGASDPLAMLDARPSAAPPREYHFPRFERRTLDNGLTLVTSHLPGRPLLLAQLLVRGESAGGASSERADLGGITVLTARALSEGTVKRDAVALIEAGERLGAELSADAGWDSFAAGVEVPRSRLGPALELLAEMSLQPSFPAAEIERLRDERLNDLKQARADPRRRIERVFPETIYAPDAPYARPLSGVEESVKRIDRDAVVARHAELMRASAACLLVCGDLEGVDVEGAARRAFGEWPVEGRGSSAPAVPVRAREDAARVVLVDRPGSPQSEIRVGHVGLPRRIPDFHAVSILNTIFGGLFSSRLNRLLREQRGYAYGAHSSFDLRRDAGPFAVRTAVETDVTVPAVRDILGELRAIREAPVTVEELTMARDYLVGVFPLRFETAGQVASAIGGLIVFDLPDDELDRYRPAIADVSADDVLAAARDHIRPDEAAIVVVGDVARFETEMRDAGLGDVSVVRDAAPGRGGADEPAAAA